MNRFKFNVCCTFFNFFILFLTISAFASNYGVESANILFFFSIGTFSHKQSIWPLATALADRGHNVTYASCFEKRPYSHPKVHDLYLEPMFRMMKSQYNKNRVAEREAGKDGELFETYHDDIVGSCRFFLESAKDHPITSYLVHDAKFDLVVSNVVLGECGLILAQKYGAKLIISASTPMLTWFYDEFGFPDEPATIPEITGNFHYPMGFYDRIWNYLRPLYWFHMRQFRLYPRLEQLRRATYGDEEINHNVPLLQVQQNASLIFVLSHYSTDFPRSLPPMVVNIGGMQCFDKSMMDQKESEEFTEILDKATDGVVLIAFGSTINLADMPDRFKSMFLETMEHFPEITFIWKWDGPVPDNLPKNLKLSKWLPQVQILKHPNTRAFISHAGLNSVTEATFFGVPLILLPLFADQDYNGYRLEAMETGIRVELRELSTAVLVNALSDVLTNPKYLKNMKRMSEMMRDRIQNPIDEGVYWTEFVLRHDTLSLKPLRNQTWFQRRQLDVLLFLFSVLAASFLLIILAVFYTCRFLFRETCAPSNPSRKSKQSKLKRK